MSGHIPESAGADEPKSPPSPGRGRGDGSFNSPDGRAGAPTFPPTTLAWSVWGLGALLYLIGFYQRVAPAVITDQLMLEFSIGGAALGNLSAFY